MSALPVPRPAAQAPLPPVAQSMMVPLLGRALGRSDFGAIGFVDPHAEEVCSRLLDRAGASPDPRRHPLASDLFPLRLCAARSLQFDALLRPLLAERPGAPVITIGAGLATTDQRLGADEPQPRPWIFADLPEPLALRRQLLPGDAHTHLLEVRAPEQLDALKPWLRPDSIVIIEGVLAYLPRAAVRATIDWLIETAGPGLALVLDSYHPLLLGFSRMGSTFRQLRLAPAFGLRHPSHWARVHPRLKVVQSLDVMAPIPWSARKRVVLPWLLSGCAPQCSATSLRSI